MIDIKDIFKAAPMSSSFVLVSILGFLISVFYVTTLSIKFGAAFSLVFLIMFLASFVSMTKAPLDDKLADDDLSIHEHKKHLRRYKIKK